MADEKVLITESTLDNIGEAIREKNGETDLYYPREMPAAIRRIRTGEGGGSIVAVYPILVEGEHIADIVVDGERYNIYAPEQITYVAGDGIEISGTSVSVSESLRRMIAGKVDTDALETIVTNLNAAIAGKQDVLVAGQNITIQGNVISATGGGSDVEANPTGEATDELTKIRIGETIYDVVGGGSGGGLEIITEHFTGGTETTSRTFTLPDGRTPFWVRIKGYITGQWYADCSFKWGDTVMFGFSDNRIPYNLSYAGNDTISYGDGTFTITGYNTGWAFNSATSNFDVDYIYNSGGGAGGASAVSDLTDVELTNLANGQVLKYNSTTQKWENANESGGSSLPFEIVINATDNGIDLVYEEE